MVLLSRIHWIFGGVVSGHDVCWASWTRQDWQKGLRGQSVSLAGMVPVEGWIEEWTSKVTPTSTCLPPAHCAGLLGLSSKRQISSWMVLSGFPVSAVATLTQWSLGDTRKTRTTVRERDEWDCINHTFTVRGGSSKNDLTCKNRCDFFFFFNVVGVFSTSVLNHLSASLVQVCRRNAYGMSDVELCAILPGPCLVYLGCGEEPSVGRIGQPLLGGRMILDVFKPLPIKGSLTGSRGQLFAKLIDKSTLEIRT